MLWGDGFEIETLIAVRAAKAGMRIAEVPSLEKSRVHGRSNLNAFTDGRRVLRTLLAEKRRSKLSTTSRVVADQRLEDMSELCATCSVPEPVCYCAA